MHLQLRALIPRALVAIGLAATALGFAAWLGASSTSAQPSAQAAAEDPACVVAQWEGARHALTVADVRALAATLSPSPTGDEAKRWALDIHLAAWDRGEQTTTPRDLHAAHRAWLTDHGFDPVTQQGNPQRLRADHAALLSRAGVAPGPCHPPRE